MPISLTIPRGWCSSVPAVVAGRQLIIRKKKPPMTTFLRTATIQWFLAAACFIAVAATQVNADDQVWTTKVNGVISPMRSGLIMVTTSWGSMTIQSDALTEAKVGEGITVWVNENNVVIDAYPSGMQ